MELVCDLKPSFCDENCESGFDTDREYGVIYPPMAVPDELMHLIPIDAPVHTWGSGLRSVPWTIACDALGVCRYCKKEVHRNE